MTRRILVVDDDRAFRLSTSALLESEGHEVEAVPDAAAATAAIEASRFDLVLLDLRMPGLDGITLTEVLRRRGEGLPVLMISGYGTVDTAVRALHNGADDFLTKPVEPEVLLARIQTLLDRRPDPQAATSPLPEMVGRAAAMQRVYRELRQVAHTDATVLITGETGTGKELAARAVHRLSGRSAAPFVAVNCAALAEGLIESELFGHRRGAFTGAVSDRKGLIRSAHGGTLFLDEIGDVPLGAQQRLLRVLQEREVTPLGSSSPEKVDVRLVAATHRDLAVDVASGRFREDLFFRLDVFRIAIPPLRERPGDIPLLVEHRLRNEAVCRVSPLAMRSLVAYEWPGNVRQLLAVVESARIRAEGGTIEAQHLPEEVRRPTTMAGEQRYQPPEQPSDERAAIEQALRKADGIKVRAAQLLGMSRTTLWRKLKEYDLE